MSRRTLRRYARRDSNEPEIVNAIKGCGASWLPVAVRDGPDGVIGWQGRNILVEIKTEKGKHKPGQEMFAAEWRGEIHIVRTPEDVVRLLRNQEHSK